MLFIPILWQYKRSVFDFCWWILKEWMRHKAMFALDAIKNPIYPHFPLFLCPNPRSPCLCIFFRGWESVSQGTGLPLSPWGPGISITGAGQLISIKALVNISLAEAELSRAGAWPMALRLTRRGGMEGWMVGGRGGQEEAGRSTKRWQQEAGGSEKCSCERQAAPCVGLKWLCRLDYIIVILQIFLLIQLSCLCVIIVFTNKELIVMFQTPDGPFGWHCNPHHSFVVALDPLSETNCITFWQKK